MAILTLQHFTALSQQNADLVAVAVAKPFDAALALPFSAETSARLVAEAKRVEFDGSLGSSVAVSGGDDAPWVALVGAGSDSPAKTFRRVGSKVVKVARELKAKHVALVGTDGESARFATEGAILTSYQFLNHRTGTAAKPAEPSLFSVIASESAAAHLALGRELAESVVFARDLANEHPGKCTPRWLGEKAEEIAARYGFEAVIKGDHELELEGFRLILAVGRGSQEPSRLIHLTYRGEGPIARRIALVGKGVTFDSGGYSLKPADSIVGMHLDMGGAAAVLGTAEAIGRLRPKGIEVHFIVPSAENMVSGNAYRLNEVFTSYDGQTVEILNTDAEGRLILADALAYARTFEPDVIIDLATLTGACVVALGLETAGLFSNTNAFADELLAAADGADEALWRLPLAERLEEALKSDVADLKNVGPRWGGAISAALFLKRFVGTTKWAHIDLAGPAMAEREWEYINKGGTGFGVALLTEYLTRSEP